MESQAVFGRRLVLAIIVINLGLAILDFFVLRSGPLPARLVPLLLTVVLCILLYLRVNWARWVAAVLYGVGGIVLLIFGANAMSSNLLGLGMAGVGVGVVYLVMAFVLSKVWSVHSYFNVGKKSTT